jgi:hypothetical protein
MGHGIGRRRRGAIRWQSPLVGLLALLALLGHDALMAGDAHAAPSPAHGADHSHSRHPHHRPTPVASSPAHVPFADAATVGASREAPTPDRLPSCEAIRAVVRSAPDAAPKVTTGGGREAALPHPAASRHPRLRQAPPTSPPETRRALLQVFLI